MKVLSLFDGMACGALALQAADIPIENYNAYEIDKYAIQTATHNFPFIKEHGDVFTADFTQYKGVDIILGGSPCTHWSVAQRKNRETTAEGIGWDLFQQYVRAVREAEPKYFIYENNYSMSDEIRDSISETFGFEPVYIDSALVSAQSRKRLYWVGKHTENGYEKVIVGMPEDKGVLVRDILDKGTSDREKGYCLTHIQGNARDYLKKHHTNVAFVPVNVTTTVRIGDVNNSNSQGNRVYSCDGKAVTQMGTVGGAKSRGGLYMTPTEKNKRPIYEVVNGLITYDGNQYPVKLKDGCYLIRPLTINESKRLQTVPEWYEFPVSDTQARKLLGNGWTVEVIAHLLKCIERNQNNGKSRSIVG